MSEARQTEILEYKFGTTSATPTASPVTVSTSSTLIAAANTKRQYIILQNNSTEPAIVRLGGAASTTAYNFVLSDCTANRDGKGASVTIDNYQGAIYGIVESSTTMVSVTEIVRE